MNIPIRRGQVYGRPVTLMLGGFMTVPKHPVASAISTVFKVDTSDLHRQCRVREVIDARLAYYQLLSELGWTRYEIASLVGRHPVTVQGGIQSSRDREETDPQYREKLNAARAALRP